ncbi:hypothetical protein CI102_8710 [Trichoderma harzianum]|nr:hypothetical protein CI102_8710 [Trichoderma harzianum]
MTAARCKRPPPSLRRENSGTDRNKRCYTDQRRPDRKLPLRQGSRDEAKRPKMRVKEEKRRERRKKEKKRGDHEGVEAPPLGWERASCRGTLAGTSRYSQKTLALTIDIFLLHTHSPSPSPSPSAYSPSSSPLCPSSSSSPSLSPFTIIANLLHVFYPR